MNSPLRRLGLLLLVSAASMHHVSGNLVQDPNFTSVTYSGSLSLNPLFGQFGSETGSALTVASWTTSGYNFVFAPGTADSGTSTGANSGQPNEAPGQYNTTAGYGDTYLWGSNNSGLVTLPATDPAGGNFIAADGAYETGAISQTITGLTAGSVYALTFYWAAAQQQSFSGATTENWTATLGSQSFTTTNANLASHSFSGWMQQTFDYTATSATETLSFLAAGTPSGEPPFSLLGGVSLTQIPEPSGWALFAGLGVTFVGFGVARRRWRAAADAPGTIRPLLS